MTANEYASAAMEFVRVLKEHASEDATADATVKFTLAIVKVVEHRLSARFAALEQQAGITFPDDDETAAILRAELQR